MKPLYWIGSSKKDLLKFPKRSRRDVGYALHFAQAGTRHCSVKPLKGIESGVLEIVENYDTNTYRVVYTVRFGKAVYVLHAFQKKSKKGIKTTKEDIALIQERLKIAEQHYAA